MKHSVRVACPVCETKGEVPDEEMSSGWRQCGHCMAQGWLDETPEPKGTPHPDPEAPVLSSMSRIIPRMTVVPPRPPSHGILCGSDQWAN